jgi:hypothetical protein
VCLLFEQTDRVVVVIAKKNEKKNVFKKIKITKIREIRERIGKLMKKLRSV